MIDWVFLCPILVCLPRPPLGVCGCSSRGAHGEVVARANPVPSSSDCSW